MLIKDLVIQINDNKTEFFCNVVIKRNDKFYEVPVRVQSNRDDAKETLEYALDQCERVDEHWLIPKDEDKVVEHLKGKVIRATEIEL